MALDVLSDGDCSEISWQFLGFSMPQWLVAIFAAYLLVFVVVAIGNLIKGSLLQLSREALKQRRADETLIFVYARLAQHAWTIVPQR